MSTSNHSGETRTQRRPDSDWILAGTLVPALATCAALLAPVASLSAQTGDRPSEAFSIGLGVGGGTGRFGGPGIAAVLSVGGGSHSLSLNGEFMGVFRREHYAEGGAFFPDPGRTRTLTRFAATVGARLGDANGPFGRVGIGLGGVDDINTSVLDATPITVFGSVAATAGVGTRWRLGPLTLGPRADLMLHMGSRVRATAIGAVAVFVR